MKKAQTQQVFIYIMIIIVVGALLIIGFRSINTVLDRSCDVEKGRFVTAVQNDLERNTRFGFVQITDHRAPCSYEFICFANTDDNDLEKVPEDADLPPNIQSLIDAEVQAGTERNVFLVDQGGILEPIISYENLAEETAICFEVRGGRFEFLLEGIGGGKVKVSAP
ncbi:MAG: hypothetical protein ACMXX7_01195 [Candidatus Woesearchaeota archaeon]